MPLADYALVVFIIFSLILIIWSRVMQQRMIDTLTEIRDFIRDTFKQDE